MNYNNTVAILGACNSLGSQLARSINSQYQLLLMDESQVELTRLCDTVTALNKNASVAVLQCSKSASWEADIIVITAGSYALETLASKIQEVATRKIVIWLTDAPAKEAGLQALLPHSRVVTVMITGTDAIVTGDDAVAKAVAEEMMQMCAYSMLI
ncbi:MAG: oxidoreductase coenzyme F420-dependent [Ferruginibacter sp.]|uniref:hypothetical protein n=1 Tax=Ferruginibacter sp. TaxID=1940288 RepID=UPI00265A2394|nr:hypothetical protein [Ferruginibacter sp.]MDB5278526.1 oxidoreductase coenzyme F420-dependent [Ferruginibacter sp.]